MRKKNIKKALWVISKLIWKAEEKLILCEGNLNSKCYFNVEEIHAKYNWQNYWIGK